MARSILKISALAFLASASVFSAAQAGGFARGEADTDILFEEGNFNMRSGATYVNPTRKFTAHGNPALVGTNYTDPYVVFSGAVKVNINDDLRCAATLAQPYGGSTTFAAPTLSGKLSETFTINELGVTCGYKFDLAKGRAWIIGGVYQEMFDYERVNFRNAFTRLHLGLKGTDVGFRVGAAYEIPEIALRAQLMYRAASSYGADGTLDIRLLDGTTVVGGPFNAIGTGDLPQSLDLSLQSGVAPGWLVFGSVKWTDWSVTEQLIVNVPALGATQTNNYFWKDGWTVSAGVGHAFTEKLSGLASLTWDSGVKSGFDTSSDTWTLGSGVSYKDDFGGEFRFGGGVTYISGAATDPALTGEPVEAVGSGWAYAIGVGYKTKW